MVINLTVIKRNFNMWLGTDNWLRKSKPLFIGTVFRKLQRQY